MENTENLKALLVVKELLEKLDSIDSYQFPNKSAAQNAKLLLIDILKSVIDSSSNNKSDEKSLIDFAKNLDLMVFHLSNSNTNKINWAIVQYSDDLLESLYNKNEACIIYSRYIGHTYFIYELTQVLEVILEPVLDKDTMNAFLEKAKKFNIWCLCLSSIDENNITTFANIAHEIGHIFFKKEKNQIDEIANKVLTEIVSPNILKRAINILKEDNYSEMNGIVDDVSKVLFSFIEEISADVVGALLLGPTFLLSLNEFTRDVSQEASANIWFVEREKGSTNYPSIEFRKKCIKILINYDAFLDGMKRIKSLNLMHEKIDRYLTSEVSGVERFVIKYEEELESYLNNFMIEISEGFLLFAQEVYKYIKKKYNKDIKESDYNRIDCLIKRLSNKVPPNIVTDETLLGQIANYSEILLSSYLYKIDSFYNSDDVNLTEKIKDLSINNRLTTKAIECTYMQNEYLKRKDEIK